VRSAACTFFILPVVSLVEELMRIAAASTKSRGDRSQIDFCWLFLPAFPACRICRTFADARRINKLILVDYRTIRQLSTKPNRSAVKNNRKLFPIRSPMNTHGRKSDFFVHISIYLSRLMLLFKRGSLFFKSLRLLKRDSSREKRREDHRYGCLGIPDEN